MLKLGIVNFLSRLSGAAVLATMSCAAWATDWPGLPASDQVATSLASQPRVLEAQAMLEAAKARSIGIKAGSYEWTARAGLQNRSIRTGPDDRFTEWEGALEKSFRLPGKAMLDGRLGDAGVNQADQAVGDAMHESARELLKAWFDYARAQESVKLWQAQVDVFGQQAEIVDKRIRAGDAPKLEREAARAALSQSQSQAARAMLQQEAGLSLLKARYPAIDPARLAWPDPMKVEGSLETWREAVLADNHELAYARAVAEHARLHAERLAANLRPDPALGLRFSSERGGEEKVLGAYVSVPLPGAARRAERDAAEAEARAATTRENAVKIRLMQETESQYVAALRTYEVWQNAMQSADAYQKQADGAARAYELGEGSLSESLTSRRLALEAKQNEVTARADALEAFYRLKLDAHQLWPFQHDGND